MSDRNSYEAESDVEADPHVAGSRAHEDEDGSYVGRAAPDDDFDAGETGAETRGRHRR
ncbi:hypothetical protein [Mycobacterium sp. AZCC_0083]|jgi:hypothetical protein|uniref:hypothetical protein n=1 Tax=Mycobacterium sp. AZCC_0083 TaxID=2735882 RepID=UPI00162236C0|nr:hypothetical protein [Mycobacterium sp. AZCC_0083]MBB5162634.1 hypothetical protein [Mycobacterium sp. AZCC_0083]